MKWSPPRIARRKVVLSLSRVLIILSASSLAGCASVPALPAGTSANSAGPAEKYTPEEQAALAAMPRVPEFDLTPEPPAAVTTTEGDRKTLNSVVTANTAALAAPAPSHPGSSEPVASPQNGPPSPSTASSKPVIERTPAGSDSMRIARTDKSSPGSESSAAGNSAVNSVNKPAPPTETSRPKSTSGAHSVNPADSESLSPTGSRLASKSQDAVAKPPVGFSIEAPKPFAWTGEGQSSGNRPFQVATIGDDGYRTLVIGSVVGDDPLALQLVDELARRLHADSVILGGFSCTIVRTLNPDGEMNQKYRNEKGQYINQGFPVTGKPVQGQPAEVTWVLKKFQDLQPQRIVHIRSTEGASGIVASGYSSETVARDAAEWLRFKLIMLPESARHAGSMERYVSANGLADMITVGIPDTTPKAEVWELYGDSILNLLIGEDLTTRDMARKQSGKSSADRRNQAPEK